MNKYNIFFDDDGRIFRERHKKIKLLWEYLGSEQFIKKELQNLKAFYIEYAQDGNHVCSMGLPSDGEMQRKHWLTDEWKNGTVTVDENGIANRPGQDARGMYNPKLPIDSKN